ncbi:LPS export ABC transporter permease LptF [Alphaproteobacteria bacterium 46_93_T64]|nr:LPS export ABC transporter permease LptF [Alphaproteobacteria bacterium 46_93_T64]
MLLYGALYFNRYTAAMKKINWYIISQLLGPIAFITFTMTGIIWLSQTLQFVEKLISGLPISTFLYLTVLLIPGILKYTLLLGLFFGTLFAFNRLYTESEIVVMWAAGLSKWALAKPALYVAILVSLVLYGLGFFLAPYGIRTVKELRYEWRESLASVVLREGVFNSLSKNVTVYVREKTKSGKLIGILVHDERNIEKPVTYMAQEGAFIKTKDGPRFIMKNGNLQEVQKDQAKLSILYFDDYTLDVSQFEKKSSTFWLKPEARYFGELIWPEETELTRRNAGKIRKELHTRIILPIYAFALVFIAIAGVLSGEFSRRGRVKTLLAASVSGVGLLITAMALFSLASSNPGLIPLLYLLPIFSTVAAAHLAAGGKFSIPFGNKNKTQPPHLPTEGIAK